MTQERKEDPPDYTGSKMTAHKMDLKVQLVVGKVWRPVGSLGEPFGCSEGESRYEMLVNDPEVEYRKTLRARKIRGHDLARLFWVLLFFYLGRLNSCSLNAVVSARECHGSKTHDSHILNLDVNMEADTQSLLTLDNNSGPQEMHNND